MNTISLGSVIAKQNSLRALNFRLDRLPNCSMAAEALLAANPGNEFFRFSINKDKATKLPLRTASGSAMLRVAILKAFAFSSKSPLQGSSGLLLENGEVFAESRPCKTLLERNDQSLNLLTPETTFASGLCAGNKVDGPHLYVTDDALPWVIENFELLQHAVYVSVTGWASLINSLADSIFGQDPGFSAQQRSELCHRPIKRVLPRFDVLADNNNFGGHGLAPNAGEGKAVLEANLVSYGQAAVKKRSDPSYPQDCAKGLLEASQRKLLLKPLNLAPAADSRIRDIVKAARANIQASSLLPELWPGLSQIVEVMQISKGTHLLFDPNGFSGAYKGKASPQKLIDDFVIPSSELAFPLCERYQSSTLLPKRPIVELIDFVRAGDTLKIASQLLRFVGGDPHHYGSKGDSPKAELWARCKNFFGSKFEVYLSPTFSDIVTLSTLFGKPPYTFGRILEAPLGQRSLGYSSIPHHRVFDELIEDIKAENPRESILKLLDHPAVHWKLPETKEIKTPEPLKENKLGRCPDCGHDLELLDPGDMPFGTIPAIGCFPCQKLVFSEK